MIQRLVLALAVIAVPQAVYAQFPSQNISLPTFVIPASAVNGGGVFTGQLLAPVTPVDCSAPQYSFQGDTDTGVGYVAANVVALCGAGNGNLLIGNAVARLGSAFSFGWSSATSALAAIDDTSVFREAAGHSFWRVGTAAQRASWANTYTSSTNYEAFSIDWQTVANTALVGTRTAATGTSRTLRIGSQSSTGTDNYSSALFAATTLPFIRLEPIATGALTGNGTSSAGTFIQFGGAGASTASSGQVNYAAVQAVWNQSSTAAGTDLLVNRTETSVGSGAQYGFEFQRGGTMQFAIRTGRTGAGMQIRTAQQTVPTCSTNCGTSPSVAGTDTAMTVTMGSSGVPASGWVVTFNGTWASSPACSVTMAKAGMVAGKMALTVVTTTTTITVVTNGTAPSTTDIYNIICVGIS